MFALPAVDITVQLGVTWLKLKAIYTINLINTHNTLTMYMC